jgi:hypothetical protein
MPKSEKHPPEAEIPEEGFEAEARCEADQRITLYLRSYYFDTCSLASYGAGLFYSAGMAEGKQNLNIQESIASK